MIRIQERHLTFTNKNGTEVAVPAIIAGELGDTPVFACRVESLDALPSNLADGALIVLHQEDENG